MALLASGTFFLTGLLTGVWKYAHMARSAEATSPAYVDIAHRASLMYAFACLVLLHFVALSPWPDGWTLAFAAGPILFFALAVGTYIVHGILDDTDNQLRSPHRLGRSTLPPALIHGFMWALIAAEIGGFLALFAGALITLLGG
ncbi:MAG: hypothetical protein EA398_11205 [Deltaproteobacteria bacterium]|nr:MAG: hypothetical protein EA398_11205 [Deltaproteobacteria bacterium]